MAGAAIAHTTSTTQSRVTVPTPLVKAAAMAYGIAAGLAPADERLDPASLRALQHGRELHRRHTRELEDFIRSALADTLAQGGPTAEKRAAAFIDVSLRKRATFRQEPVEFFYPGLPAIEFYEREMFPWLEALEAATEDIHAELLSVLDEDAASLEPYVAYPDNVPLDQWAELNHSTRWTGYHMLKDGERVEENCRRVPRTMEAISLIDQPRVLRRSPAAMFSVLEPRTRIPPHTGIANTRLVLHLPLIIPPDCGFRVGSETREWRRGEAWIFDDTINHEAWNLSDERRVILICDLWSPFLNEVDRQIVAETMSAMDLYNDVRPNAGL